MLRRMNDDIIHDENLDPSAYPEVQSLEWISDHKISRVTREGLRTTEMAQNRGAVADVNNDGVDDIAYVYEFPALGGHGDHKPSFMFFDGALKNKVLEHGVELSDLLKNGLGDHFLIEDSGEDAIGGFFGFTKLPIQEIVHFGKPEESSSINQIVRMYSENEIYPLIHESSFYLMIVGPIIGFHDYDLNSTKKNLAVIRSYESNNMIKDTCYFLRILI